MHRSLWKHNPYPQLVDELLDEQLIALRQQRPRQEQPQPPATPPHSAPARSKPQPHQDPCPEVSVIPASHKAARGGSRQAEG